MDAAAQVKAFFSQFRELPFEKGEVLVQADTEPSGVFYVVSGQVRQYDIAPSGEEVVVNVFKPAAFFPMSWAINHTPNKYVFEAFTDVVARCAPADKAVDFLHDNPEVTFDLLARVFRGTDGIERRMVYMMQNDARRRLLLELLISAERFGERATDGSIFVPIHENELAARVGLARETANRALRHMKDNGLMEVS